MSDMTGDIPEDDGSHFITHAEGASPDEQRRLDDEIGIASGQAIGGLAGDAGSDDDAKPSTGESA